MKKEELLPDKFVELQLDENVTLSYNLYGGFITLKVTCKGVDDCGVSIGELLENYQFEANELYSLHLENDITPTLKKDSYYDIYWFS